jgi:biopolymer transport protein ExbB
MRLVRLKQGGKTRLMILPAALGAVLFITASVRVTAQEVGTAAATQPASPPGISAFELFVKGGFFMYPLALCSVVSLTIIIERFFALRRRNVIPRGFMAGLRKVFRDVREDRDAGIEYCRRSDTPIARMVLAGIKRMPRGIQAAEKAIEDAGGNEALKLRRNMRFLYALGSVATLLGLIGTISGMIKAFRVAATSGVGRVDQLSTGIYEAMVNTFGGLAVAIVVTIFYYFFVGRIERLISEMNDALAEFSDEYGFNAESETEMRVTDTL